MKIPRTFRLDKKVIDTIRDLAFFKNEHIQDVVNNKLAELEQELKDYRNKNQK